VIEILDVLQHIMDDSDYNVFEGSSLDEEDCAEVHSSTADILDIIQFCFSLYFSEYFTPFHFFFEWFHVKSKQQIFLCLLCLVEISFNYTFFFSGRAGRVFGG